jgi:molecular chaperone GrpE
MTKEHNEIKEKKSHNQEKNEHNNQNNENNLGNNNTKNNNPQNENNNIENQTEFESLILSLNEKEKKILELTDLLKRVQAEFSNYMKRTLEEKKYFIKNASKEMMIKLLPILDNFELALKNMSSNEELFVGINMIYSQLLDILFHEGLKVIETQKFDPNFHEAVILEESNKDDGVILEELRKGYMLNEIVLRHSLVKVSKKIKK